MRHSESGNVCRTPRNGHYVFDKTNRAVPSVGPENEETKPSAAVFGEDFDENEANSAVSAEDLNKTKPKLGDLGKDCQLYRIEGEMRIAGHPRLGDTMPLHGDIAGNPPGADVPTGPGY